MAVSESELLACGQMLRDCGVLRRFGVLWRHQAIGLKDNVLCLWRLPEKELEDFGLQAATFSEISHCYRRQHYPDWPWQIYTMIHGNDSTSARTVIDQLMSRFPHAESLPLHTVKEYKKSRVKYKVL